MRIEGELVEIVLKIYHAHYMGKTWDEMVTEATSPLRIFEKPMASNDLPNRRPEPLWDSNDPLGAVFARFHAEVNKLFHEQGNTVELKPYHFPSKAWVEAKILVCLPYYTEAIDEFRKAAILLGHKDVEITPTARVWREQAISHGLIERREL